MLGWLCTVSSVFLCFEVDGWLTPIIAVCSATNITQCLEIQKHIQGVRVPLRQRACIEVAHREWLVKDPICRPKTDAGRHTGFLMQLVYIPGDEGIRQESAIEEGCNE